MVNGNSMTGTGMQMVSQRFATGVGHINSLKDRLQSQMDILKSRWGGQASQVFDNVMRQWCDQHKKVIDALDAVAVQLGQDSNTVHNTEENARHDADFFKNVNNADHGSH